MRSIRSKKQYPVKGDEVDAGSAGPGDYVHRAVASGELCGSMIVS